MENSRKNLKILSWAILICLALSFVRTAMEVFSIDVPVDSATDTVVLVARVLICLIYVIIYMPQLYIGVKGIKVANKPDSSKTHIIWGVIFFIFSILATATIAYDMIATKSFKDNVLGLVDSITDVLLYFAYVYSAKAVLEKA